MDTQHYKGPYTPLHADFLDANEHACRLTETISCDIRPRILLGTYGHLMTLTPAIARRLIPQLIHFAAHGRLAHRTTPITGDYEI
jgi:hypothetical protein